MSEVLANDLDFLGESYEVPESGGSGGKYLKLKEGTTHFRVLSQKALKGWEYWTLEGKPKRVLVKPESTPFDIRIGEDGKPERVRHFWAMAVWDYSDRAVKILQITQATIQKAVKSLVNDADFGHPTKYDLKILRSGTGIETEYSVMPLHKPMPREAIVAYEKQPIYLEALLHNADPFSSDSAIYSAPSATPGSEFIEGADLDEIITTAKESGYTAASLKLALNQIGIPGSKKIPHDRVSEVLAIAKNSAKAAQCAEAVKQKEEQIAQGGIPF